MPLVNGNLYNELIYYLHYYRIGEIINQIGLFKKRPENLNKLVLKNFM